MFGFFVPQIVGFLYLSLMHLPGTVCVMVWGSIMCVFVVLVAMGFGLVRLGMPGNIRMKLHVRYYI